MDQAVSSRLPSEICQSKTPSSPYGLWLSAVWSGLLCILLGEGDSLRVSVKANRYTQLQMRAGSGKQGMSGKFWKITGALILAVFTVALDKYWDTAFVQGVVKGILNLPEALQRPVGVPFWLVAVASLLLAGMLIRIVSVQVRRKLEREAPAIDPIAELLNPPLLHPVTSEQKKILSYLAYSANTNSSASADFMYRNLGLSRIVFDHALNQLLKNSLVRYRNHLRSDVIDLSAKGKEYVIQNGIPTERNAFESM